MTRTRSQGLLACIVCALLVSMFSSEAAGPLLPRGSGWRYFDQGRLPGTNWFASGFDDGMWPFGFAQFGYGDGDEDTIISFGTNDENKHITTYFRTFVNVPDPGQFSSITLNLLRDDGAVVYVNGTEVFRSNMPAGDIGYGTFAATRLTLPAENEVDTAYISRAAFVTGVNLIAVEVHQYEPSSPDMSFDLELIGNPGGPLTVTRGPYLQVGTSSNLVMRWRTSAPAATRVLYGTNSGDLNLGVSNATLSIDHEIKLTGLQPDTRYFYAVGTDTNILVGDESYSFASSPVPGPARPTRIWAIGDFGTGFPQQAQVRDAYADFTAERRTDVWLMLGDNAYYRGLDHEYQAYVFNIYPTLLRQTVVWPTVGNHETSQSEALTDEWDYYRIFTMPRNGEAGGVPSGTEHYYSYDYANIHFICLDSMTGIYRQPGSAMLQWLETDLANTTRDWIIAYWHHPAYTKGSHNSDLELSLIQMRQNVVPILEAHGVDMILSGHSHSYERSFLIDGHYGFSSSIDETNFIDHGDGRTNGTGAYLKPAAGLGARRGMVYIVDGSSGAQGGGGFLDHPAMYYSVLTPGSLIIDVDGARLDGTFLSLNGTVDDTFTIIKGDYPGMPQPALSITRAGTNALITWPTSTTDYKLETKHVLDGSPWSPIGASVVTNGRRKSVSVPATIGQQFFQLRQAP